MDSASEAENAPPKSPQTSKSSSETLGTTIANISDHCISYYGDLFLQIDRSDSSSNVVFSFFLASAAFLACVAAGAGIFAFASTLASSRKTDPDMFSKGQTPPSPKIESGVQLAVRALKWGTFYAFGGCGLFFYGVWKMSGANDASISGRDVCSRTISNFDKFSGTRTVRTL